MSDDGFRVGRRVFSADHGDGVIKTYVGVNDAGTNLWGVVFANTPSGYTHPCRQADLQLLPDEPATPEPQPAEDGSVNWKSVGGIGGLVLEMLDRISNGEPNSSATLTSSPPAEDDARPDHYQHLRDAGHEPWDVIRACMTRDEALAYHRGTALVYLMRAGLKHETPDDDICKAADHLAEARSIIEGKESAA